MSVGERGPGNYREEDRLHALPSKGRSGARDLEAELDNAKNRAFNEARKKGRVPNLIHENKNGV